MEHEYCISLKPNPDDLEPFQANENNIGQVRVQLPSGEMISGGDYRVELCLTRDAMIGLGTELIRNALNNKDSWDLAEHARPSTKDLPLEVMGMFLHPKSCELIFSGRKFQTLEEELQNENIR
ncbi:MAG: hypothetical protein OXT67_13975 [Zetaproteobacteria bacterium]|nr:hypothetical protein [Zetaproteobacteria bacterium]